jgi:hypothetical protein
MRHIPLAVLLLAACSPEPAADALKPGTYFGSGRDALCIMDKAAPQRFAFIAFTKSEDTNCAAEGRVERTASGAALVPAGEGECRIPLIIDGNTLRFGQVPSNCAYYCGPGAAFAGQSFQWRDTRDMLLVQDPLGHDSVC